MVEYSEKLEVSEYEIKEKFRLLTGRPVCRRTISVGKCIAKIAQWNIIKVVKSGLVPQKMGNYYLIQSDILDKLFKELDENSMESTDYK